MIVEYQNFLCYWTQSLNKVLSGSPGLEAFLARRVLFDLTFPIRVYASHPITKSLTKTNKN